MKPYLFLAFGVDIGNVGCLKGQRPSTDALIAEWNKKLSHAREFRLAFIGSYTQTGNYVLQASQAEGLERIVEILAQHVRSHKFAVFSCVEFVSALDPIRRALQQTPSPIPGRRWTPGIVMDLNSTGGIPPTPRSDEKVAFGSFAVPRIRTAWKGDVLDPEGDTLDRTEREGGWGSLSERMRTVAGGVWTARSMRSVEGIVSVATKL